MTIFGAEMNCEIYLTHYYYIIIINQKITLMKKNYFLMLTIILFTFALSGKCVADPPSSWSNIKLAWENYSEWMDDVNCVAPADLEVTSVNGFSAVINWDAQSNAPSGGYIVEISSDNGATWTPYPTTNDYYLFTNLTETTDYLARVFSSCDDGYSDTVQVAFSTTCLAGGEMTIGNGSGSTYYYPVNNYYAYTLSQQIYTASEMNGATEIRGISFEYGHTSPSTCKTDVNIYLAHTTKDAFANTSDWDTASLTLVYSGNLNCSLGWNDFMFTTTFQYNGTDNLLVVVDDNSDDLDGTSYTFRTHTTTGNKTIHAYSDYDNPSHTSLPPAGGDTYFSTASSRVNTKFLSDCDEISACYAPNLAVGNITPNTVNLEWALASGLSDYILEYKSNSETDWTEITASGNNHLLSGLSSNTPYAARIKTVCTADESIWVIALFRTACDESTTIPYFEDFNNDGDETEYPMPLCWTRGGTSANYPRLSSSYGEGGGKSLYFYSSGTTFAEGWLPAIPETVDVQDLQLTFSLYKTSIPYFLMVGVMEDPDDPSTFELIQTVSPSSTSRWEQFTVYFVDYEGTGKHIVFRSDRSSSAATNGIYLDNVLLENRPDCIAPSNLEITSVNGFSAIITWDAPGALPPDEYVVEVSDDDGATWETHQTANTYYVISDLDEVSSYLVRVASSCDDGNSEYIQRPFFTDCLVGNELTIGNGTGTSYTYPVNNYYNYTLTQQLYLASELTDVTLIRGIAFDYAYSSPMSRKTNVDIYIGHTTKSSFSGSSDWDTTTFTLVYSGDLNCSQGWNDFLFSTPFYYNGTDNVVVMVDDNSGAYNGSSYTFSTHSTTGNMTIHVYSDSYNPPHNSLPPSGGNAVSNRVNTKFLIDCSEDIACQTPNFIVANITSSSADLAWALASELTDYQLEYKSNLDQDWTEITPTGNEHQLDQLNSNTAYSARIKTICTSDESDWVQIDFRTDCAESASIPMYEDFESNGANSPNYPMPFCWTRGGSAGEYPYQSTSYGENSSTSLYFYSGSTTYSTAILPAIAEDVNIQELQLTFSLYRTSAAYELMVGVMTDPNVDTTFQLLGTFSPSATSTWENFTLYFTNYTDTGKYIVIRSDRRTAASSNYMYLDNLLLEYTPDCSAPVNAEVDYAGGTSALLSWDPGALGTPINYIVEMYDEANSEWTELDEVTATYYVLENLTETSNYSVRVRATCEDEGEEVPSMFATVDFSTTCISGGTAEIGTATTTTYNLPVNNYYNYTLSQQIYLATELGGPKAIEGIAFSYAYTSPSTYKTNVSIYLGHTSKNNFTSTSDWEGDSVLQLCYTGHLNCSQGWNTFILDSVFNYNGTDNLILVIDDNSGNYNSSLYVFDCETVSDNLSIYYYNDSSNPSLASPPTASSYNSRLRNNVKFIEPCDQTYTCAPTNIMIHSITHNSAEAVWSPPGTESEWIVEYKSEFDTSWTSLGNLTTTSHSFTNLLGYTRYYVRITTVCGTDRSTPKTAMFTTDCGYLSALPYIENFDRYGSGSARIPYCWTRKSNYGEYPYLSTTYSTTSPASLYFYASATTYSLGSVYEIETPTFEMSDLSVEFSIRATVAFNSIYVGAMTDPADESTFELIEKIDLPVGSWTRYNIPFNTYAGSGKFITFKADGTQQGYTQTFYIDSLIVDEAPLCYRPLSIKVSDITLTDCVVSWNSTAAGEYEVVIVPFGDDPSTGTGHIVTDTFYFFQDELNGQTQYDAYVRTICGPGDESDWSYPVTFWTDCEVLTYDDIPYTESFDTWGTGNHLINFPNCWNRMNNFSATQYPYISTPYSSSPGALYFYSTSASDYTIATFPELDASISLDTLELKFKIFSYSENAGIEVGVMSDPFDNATFSSIGQFLPSTSSTWTDIDLDFSSYTGTGRYIALRISGYYTSAYVDNILLDFVPPCQLPNQLTGTTVSTTEVMLEWNERGNATSWEIQYGASGFTPEDGTGTSLVVTTNPYTVQGLSDATNYDFYVRSICSVTDTSAWAADHVSVTTLCNTFTTLPYTEDFEHSGAWPACWTQEYVNGTTDWAMQSGGVIGNPSGAQSGSYNARLSGTTRGHITKLISPTFDFTGYENGYITFYHAHMAWGADQDEIKVYYQATTTDDWTLLATYNASVSWTFDSLAIPTLGSSTRIAFEGTVQYGYGACLDNIVINASLVAEECLAPVALSVPTATITTTSAVVNWQAGGDETAWILEFKKSTEQDYGTTSVTGTPTHMIPDLSPATLYNVRVKTVCADGESDYVSNSFTTKSDTIIHYTITVICGPNGTISPAGPSIDVTEGSDIGFTVTPNTEYVIESVIIDGTSMSIQNNTNYTYTFSNIDANHTIEAQFSGVGIDELEIMNQVKLYPNPTNDVLNISLSVPFEQVEIMNLIGQTLAVLPVNDLHFTLDVNSYNAGVYFVRLKGANGVVTKKFVKK